MKKILALLALAISAKATTLTGTISLPNGNGATGQLIFSLSQQAALASGGCGGTAQIMPTYQAIVTVTNGALIGSPHIYGNDCLAPVGTFYYVLMKDNNGNQIFNDRWVITGSSIDVGTIVSYPTNVTGTIGISPLTNVVTLSGNETITGQKTFSQALIAFGPLVDIGSTTNPFTTGWFQGQLTSPDLKIVNGTVGSPTDFFGFSVPFVHTFNMVDSSADVILEYYNGGGLSTSFWDVAGNWIPNGTFAIGATGTPWANGYFSNLQVNSGGALTSNTVQNISGTNLAITALGINDFIVLTPGTSSGKVEISGPLELIGGQITSSTELDLIAGPGVGGNKNIVLTPHGSGNTVLGAGVLTTSSGPVTLLGSGAGYGALIESASNGAAAYLCAGTSCTGNGFLLLGLTGHNNSIAVTDSGGTCTIGTGVSGISCASDERVKTHIHPLSSELDQILALKPVTFAYKASPADIKAGFLAQDIKKIFPDMVHTDDNGYYSVAYTELLPRLVKAIQEQQLEIDKLKHASKRR